MSSPPYAVFLSYNSADREMVQKVAIYLHEANLCPWFDQWSLIPGDSWLRDLELGLDSSSSCAVFLGSSGIGPWEQRELEIAIRRQTKNRNFRVIPVLLPNSPQVPNLPSFLDGNSCVDLRNGIDDAYQLWRLECGILGIRPEPGSWQKRQEIEPSTSLASFDVEGIGIKSLASNRRARVFVSYRHQEPDSTLAHTFAESLTRASHSVFIDTGIRWGSDWVKRITQALEESDFLLLLISRESGFSEVLVKEVEIARRLSLLKGFPIILPVRLAFPFSESLPYQLDIRLHNIHQNSWNGPADTERLIKQLLSTVAEKASWTEEADLASEQGSARVGRPTPYFDPRDLIIPGGAIEANSRFYITRATDHEVFDALQHERGLVTIRGPRQAGKTSLLMRTYVSARYADAKLRPAFIDFQALAHKDFKSLNTIWQAITERISAQLQLGDQGQERWKRRVGYDNNTSTFLDEVIFRDNDTPLLLCLDEIDCVFNSPIKAEFFGSVRSFFNRGAFDPSWKKIRWLLGSSSEPSFFIEDLTQSPFTIGLRVELNTFNRSEVEVFSKRHGLTLDPGVLDEIMNYVGGRPYLVHLILYHLARKSDSLSEIFDVDIASKGIFRDHLHGYLVHFREHKPLAKAMLGVINGRDNENPRLVERLEAAGLVRKTDASKTTPICRLYAEFFKRELK